MSFAKDLKDELTQISLDSCCKNAEVHAMLRLNSSIIINNKSKRIEFVTMNPRVARKFYSNIKELYHSDINIVIKQQTYLNKRNIVLVEVNDKVDEIIKDHQLLEDIIDESRLIQKDCCRASYLRGAFLCSGSITEPSKSYHLEISCANPNEIYYLQKIMNSYDLNAKISKRRNLLIAYLKNAEKISDFLRIIQGYNALMNFEDVRIRKDFNTMYNRMSICQTFNDIKTIDAANEQIKIIKYIEKNVEEVKIPEKLKIVMDLRKKYPQENIQSICEHASKMGIKITKSCFYHRMRKIREWQEEIMNSKKEEVKKGGVR